MSAEERSETPRGRATGPGVPSGSMPAPGEPASRPAAGVPTPKHTAHAPAPKPVTATGPEAHLVPGLASTLPPASGPLPQPAAISLALRPEDVRGHLAVEHREGGSATVGLLVTVGIHLALVLAVLFAGRGEGRSAPRPPREMIIETRILEVQAGSSDGMREKGPAYRRREGTRPRYRRSPRELHLGTSGRPGQRPKDARDPAADPAGPDDAADVPSDWGSQTGVDAPPGARSSDDRRGAGGTAEQGALDPCFTQHAQVVAGYRAEVSGKIPHMPRPAFVSVDVAKNLITSVRVAIDSGGKIASVNISTPSGNPQFDSAVTEHVRAVGAFPAPHKCVMYDKLKGVFRGVVTFTVSIRSR